MKRLSNNTLIVLSLSNLETTLKQKEMMKKTTKENLSGL